MAKRFIETSFFKDPFVRGLQGACKGLYVYLFLDCSNGGLWDVELDVARLRCDVPKNISDEDLKTMFSDKIIEVENGEKWLIKNFIKIQHNGQLKSNNKAHISAIEELKKYNLITEKEDGIFVLKDEKKEGLPSSLEGASSRGYSNGKGNSIGKSNGKDEKKAKIDFEKIISIFNSVCHNSPKVQKVTAQRKSAINARVKDYGLSKIGEVFQLVAKSEFLNGNNDRGWKADFDWVMNPNNFIKILEGKYNNNEQQSNSNSRSTEKEPRVNRQTAGTIQQNMQGW